MSQPKLGVVGGSGSLGLAICQALLNKKVVNEENLWISNRSGNKSGFNAWPHITFTSNNSSLAEACDVIILCVPPDQFSSLLLKCEGKLVLSVMAGVSLKQLQEGTHCKHVVRAMSSPAALMGLAYSPWVASKATPQTSRELVSRLFNACGQSDELQLESDIELFTAITGPVPGFVAYFADCVARFAIVNGVNKDIANRAVKQLFLSAGTLMASGDSTPHDDVQEMIDYNGTTAAGLRTMQTSALSDNICAGLQAAVEKTRLIS